MGHTYSCLLVHTVFRKATARSASARPIPMRLWNTSVGRKNTIGGSRSRKSLLRCSRGTALRTMRSGFGVEGCVSIAPRVAPRKTNKEAGGGIAFPGLAPGATGRRRVRDAKGIVCGRATSGRPCRHVQACPANSACKKAKACPLFPLSPFSLSPFSPLFPQRLVRCPRNP